MGKDLKGNELGKGLSQRKDGRYEARAKVNGETIDIYGTNLSELKKQFNIEKEKLVQKQKDKCDIRKQYTLNEWFYEWFVTSKSLSLKTEMSRKVYERRVRNTYCAELGEMPVSLITQINIQEATNTLLNSKDYSQRTIREALGGLRECFDLAVINGLIPHNPCVQIYMTEEIEAMKERRVLSNKEQQIFLEEVKDTYYDEVYQFLLLTGLRMGELTGLQWEDIDFVNKEINIQRSMSTGYVDGVKIEKLSTPKTCNAFRKIPFFGETEGILLSWKQKQDRCRADRGKTWRCKPEYGNLVFTTTLGSPVSRYVLAREMNKVEDNIRKKMEYKARQEGRIFEGFDHIHPHALRHTFCTRCFEKGIDPVVIQRIMGHSDYNITLSYTHVLNDKRQEEALKVGNFFESAS